ncbi:MAG: DUF1735 domain-containing protein [Bacteroidales bacterium]|nr:DUF1735 domain-containing protein [Bacteroidales bacterium]
MKKIFYAVALLSALFAVASCQTEKEAMEQHPFSNKLYINTGVASEEILVKAGDPDLVRTLSIGTPKPMEQAVSGVFVADQAYVENYKTIYGEPAVEPLPYANCVIENPEVTIAAGANVSASATVNFIGLSSLDRDIVYVMPIVLKNVTDINVIAPKTAVYYVFKGAALINVVCNMSENRAAAQSWATPEKFTNMTHFTAEALIRQNVAGRLISTVMGVEGHFLLRIGDSGVPDNQLQVASSSNQTNSNMQFQLGKWTHMACVFDGGLVTVYFDGRKVLDAANCGRSSVTWGAYGSDKGETGGRYFWLGYSYAGDRYLDGELSEVRIWDHCLTQEEILAPNHFYFVDPASEGLIAYWKMDDGAGTTLKDSSPNGNDLTLDNETRWPKVALPETN